MTTFFIRLVIVASLASLFYLHAAEATTSQELLSNGTFDEGLQDWVPQKLEKAEANFEIKEGEKGGRALCVTVSAVAEKRYYVQLLHSINTPLTAGKSYTLSFRARANTAAEIVVLVAGSKPSGGLLREDNIALTDKWTDYSYTFTPKQDCLGGQLTISGLAAQAGDYWFDDVSLRESPSATSTKP